MLYRFPIVIALSIVALCPVARAEQFVLVDVEYTHSTDTTRDSHFYPTWPANVPADWTKPIDYSKGSVHIVLDVKTKPAGDAPTKLQVCFEGTPSYACTAQSPTYTKPGRVEWDSPFSGFWYESTVDWSKGAKKSPLILKDTMNNKPHGNPMYMPTDLHVQVTLVSPGASFVPVPAAGSGGAGGASAGTGGRDGAGGAAGVAGASGAAGAGTAGAGQAGRGGAAGAAGAAAGAAGSAAGGGGSAGRAASNPVAGTAAAGRGGANASAPAGSPAVTAGAMNTSTAGAVGMMSGAQSEANEDDSGCRAAGSGSSSGWAAGLGLAYLALRRRRLARTNASISGSCSRI
jgi:hypothetical protein